MPDELEPETAVSAIGTETSTRLRSWSARSIRQLRRVVLVLAFVILVATAIPSLRIARIDPAQTLREE